MTKWAKLKDGVIDVISLEKKKQGEDWLEVPDDVFAGFTQNEDGSFSAPKKPAPKQEVPDSVTMAQARIALQMFGKLDDIKSGLDALDEPARTTVLLAWEYAPMVSRSGALVTTLSSQFGMTDDDLDDLFIAAGNIKL